MKKKVIGRITTKRMTTRKKATRNSKAVRSNKDLAKKKAGKPPRNVLGEKNMEKALRII